MDRIDSGETNESPFGSNLVTPTDEGPEACTNRGIHERFDVAKTILGYFGNKSLSGEDNLGYEEPCSDVIKLQPMGQAKKDISITVEQSHSLKDIVHHKEEDKIESGQNPELEDDSRFVCSIFSPSSMSDFFSRCQYMMIPSIPFLASPLPYHLCLVRIPFIDQDKGYAYSYYMAFPNLLIPISRVFIICPILILRWKRPTKAPS